MRCAGGIGEVVDVRKRSHARGEARCGRRQRGRTKQPRAFAKVAMDVEGADVKHKEGASSFFSLMLGSFLFLSSRVEKGNAMYECRTAR